MPEYMNALIFSLLFGLLGWLYSVAKTNVNIVDSMWSLFFVINALCFAHFDPLGPNQTIVFSLLVIWAIRLTAYLCIRNAHKPEDSRYQDIRRKYSPHFAVKSLFIIFVFQAILALIISYPLYYIFNPINTSLFQDIVVPISYLMIVLGIVYESIADWQLHQFKKTKKSGEVCRTGVWAYSRHPNYFGELLIVWGIFINALMYGHIYILIAPLLMTYFLFKFSGAGLMEETIIHRKPHYKDYIQSTNSIFPWPPKN